MSVKLDESGSIEGLRRVVAATLEDPGVRSLLVMCCDANEFTPATIDPILAEIDRPVFGGVFPELIHGRDQLQRGTIVVGLTSDARVEAIPRPPNEGPSFAELLDQRLSELPIPQTMFVFVDGLSPCIGALITALFDVFGLELGYIGGGAGSLSFEEKPCLLTNAGLSRDCAVLALVDRPSGVGVKHGWTTVSGPYQVTGSSGNVIETLDWKPAVEVYREVVEARTGRTLTREGFFELAKGFPFGIAKLDAEKIVRDPISMGDHGSLVCVGEVPQGSFVHILGGDADALVRAAGEALAAARAATPQGLTPTVTLFIDCISRVLFLGEQFQREIEAVQTPDVPLVGALTLGEIANSGKDYLEFYNKTSVVGVLG